MTSFANTASKTTSPSEHSPLLLPDTATAAAATNTAIPIEPDTVQEEKDDGDDNGAGVATELQDLLALAYPVMLTTGLEFLPGFTAMIQAGHLPSPYTKEYLAAAALSTMFTNVTGYSIGFGLASALDTLCSQAFGAQRFDKIGIYIQSGLLVIGCGLVPVLALNWFAGDFLLAMGQDHQIAELAQVYTRYSLIGMPFVFLYELVRKALQAQGILTPLIVIAVLGNLIQILSGYWLAYYTSWGFADVALSRSIGNMSLPLLLWVYLTWLQPVHLQAWWRGWDLRGATAHVPLFLRLGLPGMLMFVMEWWAFEVMTVMAGLLPGRSAITMSAHSVMLNVISLLYMFFMGLSVAATVRIGNHLGAKCPTRAAHVRALVIKVTIVMGCVIGLVTFLAREWIPLLFVNDPVAVASAASVLTVWAPFEICDGLNCVMQGIFRGAGMQDMAAKTNMVTFYVFGMPLAYLLAFHAGWSIEGLWLGMGLSLTLSVAVMVAVSSRWSWRALADVAQERTAE